MRKSLKNMSDLSMKKKHSCVMFDYNKWELLESKYKKPVKKYTNALHFEIHIGEIDRHYKMVR
jgi:hypothetical protein